MPSGPLEHLAVQRKGDRSVLVGPVIDQSQLHAILNQLGDLGVEIISVGPANEQSEKTP